MAKRNNIDETRIPLYLEGARGRWYELGFTFRVF
jgi:hypothetical protein